MPDHFDYLNEIVVGVLDESGTEMQREIRGKLSTPALIGYTKSGRPIYEHSKPHENPRMISGNLLESVLAEVFTQPPLECSLVVSSDLNYAFFCKRK
jgi:hypothetical protein